MQANLLNGHLAIYLAVSSIKFGSLHDLPVLSVGTQQP